jgi:hypothetical protein
MDQRKVERILQELGEQADEHGLEALAAEQRTVLLPWFARGVIGNGGFKYLFQSAHDAGAIARAFHELGCHAVGDAVLGAPAVFPGGRVPSDAAERESLLEAVDWEQLRAAEDTVYELSWDELRRRIADYVTAHPRAFGVKAN